MLTEQNDINLSIYDKTTNELKNTLYCITTMINDIKFENKLYNKTNDLVKMIKHLQDNSKDLSTNELKQLLKPVEDYTQQLSKELVLKEKEYDDKKEKDALQSMSNTLTIVLTTLHKLIHSSEFQDKKEKRGDKDARVMLKNATDNEVDEAADKLYRETRKIINNRDMLLAESALSGLYGYNDFSAQYVKDEKSLYDEILRVRKLYQQQLVKFKNYVDNVLKGFAEIDKVLESAMKNINK